MIDTFTIHTISYQQAKRAMKILFVLLMMIISGCTSQSAYKAAKGESSGYKEIALTENHYRVQFKMNGHARASAQKYALMRASELTIAQGYDWFIIEKRTLRTLNESDPFDSTARPVITRNCGLLGCRTRTQLPAQSIDIPDTETLVILEIRMGRGVRPEKESYDAREMWDTAHSDKTAQ
ncbi:CC0125/CC1285 family lipoprotein [Cellvibrio sp.]